MGSHSCRKSIELEFSPIDWQEISLLNIIRVSCYHIYITLSIPRANESFLSASVKFGMIDYEDYQ